MRTPSWRASICIHALPTVARALGSPSSPKVASPEGARAMVFRAVITRIWTQPMRAMASCAGLPEDAALGHAEPSQIGIRVQLRIVSLAVVTRPGWAGEDRLEHDAELEHHVVHPDAADARERDGVADVREVEQDLALEPGNE